MKANLTQCINGIQEIYHMIIIIATHIIGQNSIPFHIEKMKPLGKH